MASKTVLGVEEAGRGPVIGPMIIVGALFNENTKKTLKKIGVKDSKLLTSNQREELYKEIMNLAEEIKIIEVSSQEIDQRYAVNTNLNNLEAIKFTELINELKPHKAIVDCPSPNPPRFKKYMEQFLSHRCNLDCRNYADKNFVEVGAASIIAKVTRDKRVREIEKEIGLKIGSGYPSDPVTIEFLEKAIKNKEWLKKYVRKSWFTCQRVIEEKEQKKLGEF